MALFKMLILVAQGLLHLLTGGKGGALDPFFLVTRSFNLHRLYSLLDPP
jgi:hypothetical protein